MATVIATLMTGLVGLLLGLWIIRDMRIDKANRDYFLAREQLHIRNLVLEIKCITDTQRAENVRQRLADAIEMDPLKLRHTDRFFGKSKSIYSFGRIWDWEIHEAFLEECDRTGADKTQGQHITTVAEYIQYFCSEESPVSAE